MELPKQPDAKVSLSLLNLIGCVIDINKTRPLTLRRRYSENDAADIGRRGQDADDEVRPVLLMELNGGSCFARKSLDIPQPSTQII